MRERLWVIWDPNKVDFQYIDNSAQHIHGEVYYLENGKKFQFTVVYGLHLTKA